MLKHLIRANKNQLVAVSVMDAVTLQTQTQAANILVEVSIAVTMADVLHLHRLMVIALGNL